MEQHAGPSAAAGRPAGAPPPGGRGGRPPQEPPAPPESRPPEEPGGEGEPREPGAQGRWQQRRFDKFTARKKVLVLAQEEAQRLNHNYIGTEHLLLGLVREGEGIAAKVLGNLGVELSKARSAVEFIIGRGDRMVIGDISLTPRAKKVIELAVEDARRLRHNYVGTEHLLLGLIREGEGVAIGVLQSLGVLPEQLRTNLVATILAAGHAGPESGSEASGPRDNVVSCRINDRDLEKIDMLIEAGIRSTRSDAASWLIHAGIAANRQLFERVQATVGEIRRLREEAQAMARGLLANEGTAAPPPERPDQGPEAPPAGSA